MPCESARQDTIGIIQRLRPADYSEEILKFTQDKLKAVGVMPEAWSQPNCRRDCWKSERVEQHVLPLTRLKF